MTIAHRRSLIRQAFQTPTSKVKIYGNGHMQMLEMNNLQIAAFDEQWLSKALRVHDNDVALGPLSAEF
jgi:hypothetical protein